MEGSSLENDPNPKSRPNEPCPYMIGLCVDYNVYLDGKQHGDVFFKKNRVAGKFYPLRIGTFDKIHCSTGHHADPKKPYCPISKMPVKSVTRDGNVWLVEFYAKCVVGMKNNSETNIDVSVSRILIPNPSQCFILPLVLPIIHPVILSNIVPLTPPFQTSLSHSPTNFTIWTRLH